MKCMGLSSFSERPLNCLNCGAPLAVTGDEESVQCMYCGSVYTPPTGDAGVRLLGESSSRLCPVCAIPLKPAALSGHRLLYCGACEGMLVSMDDFIALIDQLRAERPVHGSVQTPPDRKALDRHINCPQCGRLMDTHMYEGPGNIVIDDCSQCCLDWLDKGELMRVVRAPDHAYPADQLRIEFPR